MCCANAAALYRHPLPDVVLPLDERDMTLRADRRQAAARPARPARSSCCSPARSWREGYDDHLAGHITVQPRRRHVAVQPVAPAVGRAPARTTSSASTSTATSSRATGRCRSASRCTSSCTRPATTSTSRCTTTRCTARCGPTCRDGCRRSTTRARRSAAASSCSSTSTTAASTACDAAASAVAAMGDADLALLAGHGVFVLGSTVRAVHQRAVALEQRCQRAWHIRAAGSNARDAGAAVVDRPQQAQRRQRLPSASGKPWCARSSARIPTLLDAITGSLTSA